MNRNNRRDIGRFFPLLLLLMLTAWNGAEAGAPAAPTKLHVDIAPPSDGSSSELTITFAWDASADADLYRLYIKEVDLNGGTSGSFTALTETTETSLTIDRTMEGIQVYSYYVTAVNASGESAPSNIVSTAGGRIFNLGDIEDFNGERANRIVTMPPTEGDPGVEYSYDADVVADLSSEYNETVRFELVDGPSGMTIDAETGVVTWTPPDYGVYFVTIAARVVGDVRYDETTTEEQMWSIDVISDDAGGDRDGNHTNGEESEEGKVSSVNARETAAVFTAYPNPASSYLTLRFASAITEADVTLLNMQGETVYSTTVAPGSNPEALKLDIADLPTGFYLLRVTNGGVMTTSTLNVVR